MLVFIKKIVVFPCRILLMLAFSWMGTAAYAQSLEAQFNTLAGGKEQVPFWLWANQLGRYDRINPIQQNLRLDTKYTTEFNSSGFGVTAGSSFDAFIYSDSPFRFTELFGAVHWHFLQLSAGAFAEDEKYGGLSSTNGNLAASQNARPHPKIRAGFSQFTPVLKERLSIYGFYEEGLLNDLRYVENTHLHRKALYLRFEDPSGFQLTGGLEHFVMWGGTHPVYGELQAWEAYFDYVFGRSGDEDALLTDQKNVLGNQYGVYQLEIKKSWKYLEFSYYMSHPFDDKSGVHMENYMDNLYGIYILNKRENAVIQSIDLEFFYTENQSGAFHQVPQPDGTLKGHGRDNYFNHAIYRSGATYQQMGIVSPFFSPVKMNDSISLGFESTRFMALHVGAKGNISENWNWKSLLSYTKNVGNYAKDGLNSFDPPRKQFSSLVQVEWQEDENPITLGASFALDIGSVFDNGEQVTRPGLMLYMKWTIFSP